MENIRKDEWRIKKKAVGGDKLGGIDHFVQQEKELEFIEMRRYYKENLFTDYELRGKEEDIEDVVAIYNESALEKNEKLKLLLQRLELKIIRASAPWKFYWDFIILLLAIFNSLTIPLTLSFENIKTELEQNSFYKIMNTIATITFFVDIAI